MTDTIEQASPPTTEPEPKDDAPIVGHRCRRCEEVKTGAPSCN